MNRLLSDQIRGTWTFFNAGARLATGHSIVEINRDSMALGEVPENKTQVATHTHTSAIEMWPRNDCVMRCGPAMINI